METINTQETWERAKRLINAATGEEWGDGLLVTDIGNGFAEPGYRDDGPVWVTGDWNPKRFRREGEPELTNEESLPIRLGEALDKLGVELLWLDEWQSCENCQKAVRTEPDSYGWTPYFVFSDHGFYCGDCTEFENVEDEFVNDPTKALPTFLDPESEGFEQFNGAYENGWHPGQDDNPTALMAMAQEAGWDEVVFKIRSVGQFDVRFNMYVRNVE